MLWGDSKGLQDNFVRIKGEIQNFFLFVTIYIGELIHPGSTSRVGWPRSSFHVHRFMIQNLLFSFPVSTGFSTSRCFFFSTSLPPEFGV